MDKVTKIIPLKRFKINDWTNLNEYILSENDVEYMCKTEIKTSIDLIRVINKKANDVYGGKDASFNHVDYIRHCSDAFAKYFKILLKDNKYLFSTLSAWNRKMADGVFFANPIKRYDYNLSCEYLLKPIIEGLNDDAKCLLNDIHQKQSISITKYLLQESYGFDLFFEGNTQYWEPIKCEKEDAKIYFFPLNNLLLSENIFQFQNRNKDIIESFIANIKINKELETENIFEKTSRLLWYYRKMQVEYVKEVEGKDFIVHFIRPSFIDFDHNMLLSLATNRLLIEEELATIDLILFKIVGLMATERVKEVEALKTKTMFSLTTHSLKTHLNTTVIKTLNSFDDKLNPYPDLKEAFEEHKREVKTLFHLTELLSLTDKIDNKEKFYEAGINTKLLSKELISYNLKEHLQKFNDRNRTSFDIEISPEIEIFDLSISIYGLYFGVKLLELFFNTIFENIAAYGKPDNKKKKLCIEINEGQWKFTNAIVDESVEFDEQQVKGNLGLFKKLIEETKSGTFCVPKPKNHEFKIEIKIGIDE